MSIFQSLWDLFTLCFLPMSHTSSAPLHQALGTPHQDLLPLFRKLPQIHRHVSSSPSRKGIWSISTSSVSTPSSNRTIWLHYKQHKLPRLAFTRLPIEIYFFFPFKVDLIMLLNFTYVIWFAHSCPFCPLLCAALRSRSDFLYLVCLLATSTIKGMLTIL